MMIVTNTNTHNFGIFYMCHKEATSHFSRVLGHFGCAGLHHYPDSLGWQHLLARAEKDENRKGPPYDLWVV